MKKHIISTLAICFLLTYSAFAQVDEIKSASKSSSGRSESSSGASTAGGSSFVANFFFQFFLGNMIHWQQETLNQRHEIPEMISIDLELPVAAQPSSYYIATPRVRGNWGIFSTDFRINYLIEEGIDEIKMLRTNDWQIIELNFIQTKRVKARLGAGFLQEAFGDNNSYSEWTAGFDLKPGEKNLGGSFEYRGASVRREVNGQLRYQLFHNGRIHGQLLGGVLYQRYYNTVTTWGVQGGIVFSIY